jgi:hypothetical protein
MDVGDFLKNVRDASIAIPIIGGWTSSIGDDKRDSWAGKTVESTFLKPGSMPIERTMQGMNWLYDNGISQPMSTFLLMGKQSRSGNDDPFAFSGNWFNASSWAKAWHTANHVSPGQAFWLNHSEGQQVLSASPVYASPGAAYLPDNWKDLPYEQQQQLLKKAGMPVVGNEAVDKIRRDHSWFSFASGVTDFAARWWVDPVVLGGKVAGAARMKYVVTPRPAGGWTADSIDSMMSSSRMAKAQDFIWRNKDQPDLINNLSMFKKSALGPRAGSIISQLKTPGEVNLFLRTTLGDAEARARLQSENAAAEVRMGAVDERISKLELEALPRVQAQANPVAEAMVTKRMDELRAQLQADEDLTASYTATLDHYGELDALNLTKYSPARAYTRTSNQRLFRTGPALGTVSTSVPSIVGTQAAKAKGIAKTRIYANDMFGSSATLIRSFGEARPNGLIAIDDLHPDSINELRGHVARIPGIGPDIRADLLNRYLKTTTEGERLDLLEEIDGLGVTKIAEKHGFTQDEAMALYKEYRNSITHGQEDLRRYSGANFPKAEDGTQQSVDVFAGHDGRLMVHPNLVTKLANDHVLIDMSSLDKTLARNASALKALRTSRLGNPDWIVDGLDHFSHLWKFATLFRLGYIPRVLSDDLLGQVARLGAATMAVRTGYGVKNLATNLFHWKPTSFYEGQEAAAREGVKYVDQEIGALTPEADKLRKQLEERSGAYRADLSNARARATRARNKLDAMDQAADPVKFNAMQRLVNNFDRQATQAEQRLNSHSPGRRDRLAQLDDQLNELMSQRDLHASAADEAKAAREKGFRQASQLNKGVEVAPGVVLPPGLGGEQGEYYMKMISSDDSLRTMLQRNKQLVHSNLQRAASTKASAPVSYPGHESTFVDAWYRAVNHQIMQDPFAVQAVKGASEQEMARWLTSTPAGRAYRKRLGIKYDTPERIASSVWHEVDEYMPAGSGLREAAVNGEADVDYLTNLAKTGVYPQYVHNAQLGEALAGSNHAARTADRVIDWWYKWAASIPADRMSRHPLFNQLYEGHARALAGQELKQGVKLTAADADRLAQAARRLALKDTRKLVFDIAHRSDAGAMLRFMSPFYAATTEAWQRWARIIADRPQTVGYASMFFNAPVSAGWAQDQDGNRIRRDGTVTALDDKGKLVQRFVPKSERMIVARVPKFLVNSDVGKALGMDSVDNKLGSFVVSQDSMNLITQGDPWFNPGTGPVVSIPASLLVKDKPKQAELLRHLGVLPYGPTPGGVGATLAQQALPAYAKNFLTSFDTSDERYQRIKLQIMQRAAYEHANLGKPMPSAQKIADMTRNYWLFSAATSFLQPFATQRQDPYQFYRDQYNALRRKDPLSADEEFLNRFGESYFVFAQATSENSGGVPATMKAVELQKKYADVIAKNPELAALIVGPEGNGPFSPEAYTYQLTTPLVPGGAEAQRTKLSADEAMAENQKRLGWARYTQLSNAVTAQLHNAGFDSFEDEGAQQYKQMRSAVAKLLGDPLLPDGSQNPYYNEQWSRDYYTVDPKRYDRMIPGLTAVAHSDLAKNKNRTDLVRLQQYLGFRQAMTATLAARKKAGGSAMLTAKANADLATAWGRIVDGLVESDTRFGDLYHRYLSRDLGVDLQEAEA